MDDVVLSYLLLGISLILMIMAQAFVSGAYAKYKKVKNNRGLSGLDVARQILDKHGLQDVYVTETQGKLSDHYDPSRKVVRLSKDIYHGTSIASVSVAAHEVGHAIQDSEGYTFMRIRSKLIPLVNFSSAAGYFAILIGCFFGYFKLIWIGVLLEVIILLFQFITLPVEFDASKRAKKELEENGMLDSSELKKSSRMLKAAAFTYVASVLTTLLEIVRLVLMARDND